MRYFGGCALASAAATVFGGSSQAAMIAPAFTTHDSQVLTVQNKQNAGRDCTPYNGPFGFYGNVWCQPPNVQSYMRNLSSRWPQETPPSLRKPKPQDNSTDW